MSDDGDEDASDASEDYYMSDDEEVSQVNLSFSTLDLKP